MHFIEVKNMEDRTYQRDHYRPYRSKYNILDEWDLQCRIIGLD